MAGALSIFCFFSLIFMGVLDLSKSDTMDDNVLDYGTNNGEMINRVDGIQNEPFGREYVMEAAPANEYEGNAYRKKLKKNPKKEKKNMNKNKNKKKPQKQISCPKLMNLLKKCSTDTSKCFPVCWNWERLYNMRMKYCRSYPGRDYYD